MPRQTPSTSYQEVKGFSKEYFSGAQVQLYFGDTFIEEAVALEYSLMENVAPIYGFASHTFDRVARGTRLIQGSFTINFTETGYLQTVLDRLSNKMNTATGSATGVEKDIVLQNKWDNGSIVGMTIEQLMAMEDKEYEQVANLYENAIWGDEKNSRSQDFEHRKEDTYFYPKNTEMPGTSYYQEMRDYGFNILVDFGRNIDLARVVCMDALGGADKNRVRTKQTIMNVQLTSVSKQMGADNQPVTETYGFIAKDIDGGYLEKY